MKVAITFLVLLVFSAWDNTCHSSPNEAQSLSLGRESTSVTTIQLDVSAELTRLKDMVNDLRVELSATQAGSE